MSNWIGQKRKIEAVTICVNYADFLRWTLPFNKAQFDRIVVVTTPDDIETQNVCEFWHVETVLTESFYANGDKFNKANGINDGLKRLSLDDWVLHLDSDIWLPPRTGGILRKLPLDPHKLYSIDRVNTANARNFFNFLENPVNQHSKTGLLYDLHLEYGSRLLNLNEDGWTPIGFFQLWNPGESGVFTYPNKHGAADRTDVEFSKRWKREHRELLAEIIALHLESESVAMGANWKGRTTRMFSANIDG